MVTDPTADVPATPVCVSKTLPKAVVPATPVGDMFASPVTVDEPIAEVLAIPLTDTLASPVIDIVPTADVPATPVTDTLASPVTVVAPTEAVALGKTPSPFQVPVFQAVRELFHPLNATTVAIKQSL
jgi:hypothetical protein